MLAGSAAATSARVATAAGSAELPAEPAALPPDGGDRAGGSSAGAVAGVGSRLGGAGAVAGLEAASAHGAVDAGAAAAASVRVSRVMDILARNSTRVAAAGAVALLPAASSLAALLPFLGAALRHSADAVRTAGAARHLATVGAALRRADLVTIQARALTLDRLTPCRACGRRLTAGAGVVGALRPPPFLVFPNGIACHTGCAPDPHTCPVTGAVFGDAVA